MPVVAKRLGPVHSIGDYASAWTSHAKSAVVHKLAHMAYFMLTLGEAFVDKGRQRYEEQQKQRSITALTRCASALGFQLKPNDPTPSNPVFIAGFHTGVYFRLYA